LFGGGSVSDRGEVPMLAGGRCRTVGGIVGERRPQARAGLAPLAAIIVLLAAVLPPGPGRAPADAAGSRAAWQDVPIDQFLGVEVPPDLGQTQLRVYVEATGHTVGGSMLDYWRATGASSVYGGPISEPFAAANGYYSQAFERGVFQYRPEVLHTEDPIMRLMPIGWTGLEARLDTFRPDGRRGGGGGDRRGAAWRPLNPSGETVAGILGEGGVFVEATGHTIAGEFLSWYWSHEGQFYLGHPLSQPLRERGMVVQYFEGGLLMSGKAGVFLAPLAAELAPLLGIDTTPVPRGDLPVYDELLFWLANNPNPLGDPYAPGPKRIEVNTSAQQLLAYQGDTLVSATYVSTGLEPNETEEGWFHVRYKLLEEDMRGFTDNTGEVISAGEDATATVGASESYDVEDIPHVMYVNLDAEALHGAYWHNNFGQRMSHGCINLPLDFAAFLYGWAPLGTPVWVHE